MTSRPSGRRVHVLSQYLWPDDAPTGIYAEQLADALAASGVRVRLVGGTGRYRSGERPAPASPIERVDHYNGLRGNLFSTAREYSSVSRALGKHIEDAVRRGDVVIVSSAPPTTVGLCRTVHERGGIAVYWLLDFYPQLVRGVWDPPLFLTEVASRWYRRRLGAWDHVVKAAGNLDYQGPNSRVIRNWPTVDLGEPLPFKPRTALYSGNLGYGHHLPSFIALCEELRREGYEITVRGDGPGLSLLPDWIRKEEPFRRPEDLVRSYWEAEVHLVAAHPHLPCAVFPSKFWNAHATGRRVRFSGLVGPMLAEVEEAERSDARKHLSLWVEFISGLLREAA